MDASVPQPDSAALVASAASGSLSAFEQLLLLYEKKIYNFMFRFVRRSVDAEDLTQETFMKVFKSLKGFNPDKPFTPWLYTIATRTAYDWLRKQQRKPESFSIDDDEHPFETIDETQTYSSIEARIDVEAALEKLKPIHRLVLLLYYERRFTYEKIADILSVPIGTVKTHLHRAKQEFRSVAEAHI